MQADHLSASGVAAPNAQGYIGSTTQASQGEICGDGTQGVLAEYEKVLETLKESVDEAVTQKMMNFEFLKANNQLQNTTNESYGNVGSNIRQLFDYLKQMDKDLNDALEKRNELKEKYKIHESHYEELSSKFVEELNKFEAECEASTQEAERECSSLDEEIRATESRIEVLARKYEQLIEERDDKTKQLDEIERENIVMAELLEQRRREAEMEKNKPAIKTKEELICEETDNFVAIFKNRNDETETELQRIAEQQVDNMVVSELVKRQESVIKYYDNLGVQLKYADEVTIELKVNLSKNVENLVEQYNLKKKALEEKRSQNVKALDKEQEIEKEEDDLKGKMEVMQSETSLLKEKCENLTTTLHSLTSTIPQTDLSAYDETIERLQQEITSVQAMLNEKERQIRSLRSNNPELTSLKQKIEDMMMTHERMCADNNRELQEIDVSNKATQSKIDDSESQIKEANEKMMQRKVESEATEQNIKARTTQCDTLRAEVKKMESTRYLPSKTNLVPNPPLKKMKKLPAPPLSRFDFDDGSDSSVCEGTLTYSDFLRQRAKKK